MEPLEALASAPSLTALATCAALLWLVYRAWLVMVIKEDDLIKLLGLDVPAAPQVSLAAIKADGAVFHWEPAEPRSSIQAYQIKINGVFVEEVGPKDTSVNVANLKPGTAYTLRVIAINHHNFHTQSEPLRFRTKPPSSDDFFDFAAYNRAVEIANDDEHEHDEKWWVEPKITPCKGFLEPTSPLPTPSDMQADDSADDAKSGETEAQLQAEGDKLRSDIAVTRKAIDEEEKGFKDQKDVFNAKHNELKDELARKTAASSELRKEVVNLEKENQRAQAKKTAEEKSLDKKLNERKKMQDDVQRFKSEMDDMAGEIERIGQQQVDYQKSSEQKAVELRDKHSEELGAIKALEDSVRETGIQNRILEEERKKFEGAEGDIDAELRAQFGQLFSRQRATPPSGKLNPAAPVFKGPWGRSADKNGTEKPESSESKSQSFDAAENPFSSATATTDFATSVSSTVPSVERPESPVDVLANLDVSPISMRKSRDGRASTVTSNAETASLSLSASWSPRASLDRSESRNTSESLTGASSVGKESWMSKLSRKGSSSKFQLPGFGSISGGSGAKEKGSSASSFFSRSPRVDKDHHNDYRDDDSAAGTEPPTPGFVSSFANSAASSPYIGGGERSKEEKKADRSSGLSWSSLRRKKKSSEKAPSINESIASERGEEDEGGAEGLGVSGA
ncbi:putative fibronectin type iii domain protein [Diplodia seriata]|uniref:Putative fibronectin type iii domain protein n=1 Tax=Diplodia seriata TaxID=420778 RepID=A0A0G2GRJ2_9PEZI|nr:putative fibronectin type iii domain protein [Diplodia seriata]